MEGLVKESFRNTMEKIKNDAASIVALSQQLKLVEDQYTSFLKSMDERYKQIAFVEEAARQKLQEVKIREEKLGLAQDAFKQRVEEVQRKEKQLESMRMSGVTQRDIDRQVLLEQLRLAKLDFEEWLKKLESKQFQMAEDQAKLLSKESELEAREKRFEELVKELEQTASRTSAAAASDEPATPSTGSESIILRHSSLIQSLIEKDLRLEAIKYIFEFNMADKFSPAILLWDHLTYLKRTAHEDRQKDESLPHQIETITKEIDDLKAMIKFIQLYKLEAEFPLDKIKKSILKRQKNMKTEWKKHRPRTRSRSKIDQLEQEHRHKRVRTS